MSKRMKLAEVEAGRPSSRCLALSSQGLCALLLNAIIQINFQPQATECKYTIIYMGNVGQQRCFVETEINRGSFPFWMLIYCGWNPQVTVQKLSI